MIIVFYRLWVSPDIKNGRIELHVELFICFIHIYLTILIPLITRNWMKRMFYMKPITFSNNTRNTRLSRLIALPRSWKINFNPISTCQQRCSLLTEYLDNKNQRQRSLSTWHWVRMQMFLSPGDLVNVQYLHLQMRTYIFSPTPIFNFLFPSRLRILYDPYATSRIYQHTRSTFHLGIQRYAKEG